LRIGEVRAVPSRTPCAFFAASAARVRWLIRLRSFSAKAA
jgi:hypothetical protein